MKALSMKNFHSALLITAMFLSFSVIGQIGGWKADLIEDSGKALDEMIEKSQEVKSKKF